MAYTDNQILLINEAVASNNNLASGYDESVHECRFMTVSSIDGDGNDIETEVFAGFYVKQAAVSIREISKTAFRSRLDYLEVGRYTSLLLAGNVAINAIDGDLRDAPSVDLDSVKVAYSVNALHTEGVLETVERINEILADGTESELP